MATTYYPTYVLLSVLVAVLASYVSLDLAHNVTAAQGRARSIWLTFGAVAMGFGIWSMHFVGMLAFDMPGMSMAYDVPLVVLSILISVGASGLALWIVSRPRVTLLTVLVGGVVMAVAIAGMHYVGMYAMRMDATIEWDYDLVALSVLIALGASFAALLISFHLRDKSDRILQKFLASCVMGIAIAGMHYVGMFAATFHHFDNPDLDSSALLVSDGLMWVVFVTTALILGLAMFGSFLDRFISRWSRRAESDLQQSEERFRLLIEAIKDYAIYMLDTEGRITLWTSGAQAITGYDADETTGRHFSMFYPERDVVRERPNRELRIARETGHYETEGLRKRKDGSLYWANVVISPLYDSGGILRGYSKVTRDITPVKEAEQRMMKLNEELERGVADRTRELARREVQLFAITNALPILIAQVNSEERIQFANDAFCTWLEKDRAIVIGMSLAEILGPLYPHYADHFRRALEGETVVYERPSHKPGHTLVFSVTLVPQADEGGFIMVATDISKHKEIEAELKNAKEAAEVANDTKSAFLANMSHEIRTPLGAILGFSELLVNTELSPSERHNSIEVIKRNGRLLSGLINDILDLSKVEAGKLEIERLDIPFTEVLTEIESLFSLEATERGLRLTVTTEGELPDTVQTDPVRLRQILLNIVGNAIKFTEKGSIDVTVRGVNHGPRKLLAFAVKDTGRGIADEQRSRLFVPFSQADVSTTRKFGGTGLGLVLAKKMAQALGGDLVLTESALGKGSTFIATIDPGTSTRAYQHTPKPPTPAPAETIPRLENRRILVVDDSFDNQVLALHFLKRTGATLETASNGAEGLEKVLSGNYDVVLMDIQMPVMDGFEATRQLRSRGYKGPIIALTAHAMAEERRRCLENGFDDHLSKPINRESLLDLVSRFAGVETP